MSLPILRILTVRRVTPSLLLKTIITRRRIKCVLEEREAPIRILRPSKSRSRIRVNECFQESIREILMSSNKDSFSIFRIRKELGVKRS